MRRRLLLATMLLLAAGLSVGAGELLVRAAGYKPSRFLLPLGPDLPVIHEPEPELGWKNKPGRWVWPGRGRDAGRDIVMTFWPPGLRATAPEQSARDRQLWIVGGSFTQGWAVTDEETWPWRLQKAFPELTVLNFGTAGYGTYQSLAVLERSLAAPGVDPELVIYGFVDFHEGRNVASGSWLRAVSGTSRAGRLRVPFATLASDGSLERHAPEATPAWPFRRQLALSFLLESSWTDYRTQTRAAQSQSVTETLLSELDRLSRSRGARLLVVILSQYGPRARAHYEEVFRRRGLEFVDCTPPPDQRVSVPGYKHPGRETHLFWSTCVADRMRQGGLADR